MVMKLYRVVGHWKASRLDAQDTRMYQEIWAEVLAAHGAAETLEHMDRWRSDLQLEGVEQRGVPWTEKHDGDDALGVGWWGEASLSYTRSAMRPSPPMANAAQKQRMARCLQQECLPHRRRACSPQQRGC